MAFDQNFFQPLGGQALAGGSGLSAGIADATTRRAPQLWSYMTTDAHATVDTSGYFNTVRDKLEIGDVILVTVINSSGVVQTAGWHVVMTKTTSAVNVSDVTALTVTNTD